MKKTKRLISTFGLTCLLGVTPGLSLADITAGEARSFLSDYLDAQVAGTADRSAMTRQMTGEMTDRPLARQGDYAIIDSTMIGSAAAVLLVEHTSEERAIRLVYIVDGKGTDGAARVAGVVDQATYCMDDSASPVCTTR